MRTRVVDSFGPLDDVGVGVRRCWTDVSNAGGAVGFPFPPVGERDVLDATERLAHDVASGVVLLFVAERESDVVGWVTLRLNRSDLTAHWATVERLQSHPDRRGVGIATKLLDLVVEHAHTSGLEHLRLVLRSGVGLEDFYTRRGWREVGRHPAALRLAPNDDRDEVAMIFELSAR